MKKINEESGFSRVTGSLKENKGKVGVFLILFIVGLVVIASL